MADKVRIDVRSRRSPPLVKKSLSLRAALFGSTEPSIIRAYILGHRLKGKNVVLTLQNALGITREQIGDLIAISSRTLARREKGSEPLDIAEADRVYRLARIVDLAVEMIGERDKALRWMSNSNTALAGESPFDMLRTEPGTADVERVLYAIGYGGVV
jgi:putative toxin-antitoxin system antitoxin component (TIGR02293 family)